MPSTTLSLNLATLRMRWEVGTEVPEGSGNSQVSLVAPGFVRLVGGDSPCSGSVEVYDRDQWKAVCHSHFGAKAAEVVCRELQCGTALSVHGAAQLGEGAGPVWDRELQCVGNESTILFCPWGASKDKACTHSNGTHVTCTPHHMSVRLVGGGSRCDGLVEVFQHGMWGRVLDEQWDMQEASVVCRQLQCGEAEAAYTPVRAERGRGPVGLRGVRCAGHEADLSLCNTSLPQSMSAAEIMEDVGVVCRGAAEVSLVAPGFIRLVGGDSPCSGSVEIYDRDQWKAVCHSHFGAKAAEVVCRDLQCGTALSVHGAAQLGEGASPVWDRELQCVGNESVLSFCPTATTRDQPCTHSNGTHVTCTRKDLGWDDGHRGCGWSGRAVWALGCAGWKGESAGWGGERHVVPLASPADPVGARAQMWPLSPSFVLEYTGFRLVNGSTACEGRVEVEVLGTWGTLCASRWDLSDAQVLCRHLGCGFAESIPGGGHFGRGTGPVWRDSFHCDGTEGHLGQCPVTALGASPCSQENAAAVICSGECWAVLQSPFAPGV
uniref:SRCR domain-containing protein n=1 Tax=Anas platyrhynchos TaxID=8839 RepID=A0A8B9T3S4_ANAPL